MRWPWSKKKERSPGNGHAARQALIEAEQARKNAANRWHDVNKVADEFAAAVERTLRGDTR